MPSTRYIVRELLPRALLISIAFKWLMPLTGLFAFSGNLLHAALFGIAFTGWFMLWGSYIMGSARAQAFLAESKGKWWMVPFHAVILLGVPAFALAFAAYVAPIFSLANWHYALAAGAVALNIVCAITHDYASQAAD